MLPSPRHTNSVADNSGSHHNDGLDSQCRGRNDLAAELPDAIICAPLGAAKAHQDYVGAKAGDSESALRLARSLMTEGFISHVRSILKNDNAVLLPVTSIEASGNNKIPRAVAAVLGQKLGLKLDTEIVQADSPQRTAMDGLERIFNAPEFDGPVQSGAEYILIDDTLTQGATFASLASHIQQNGGHVLGVIALTGKRYSAKIQPSSQLIEQLRDKFGDIEQQFKAATGYGFAALTESEARYLANFTPANAVRARIFAAGR